MMAVGAQEITSGKAKGRADGTSFMDIMNLADTAAGAAKDANDSLMNMKTPDAKAEVKTETETETKPADVKKDAKDNKDQTKVQEAPKSQKTEKAADDTKQQDPKIEKAIEDVKQAIKEELGITDEELNQVLEVLGIAMTDLLDPKVMTDMVAQVKEVTPVDIVSNEELTTLVSSLQSTVREITGDLIQELDITPEEFKKAIAEIKNEYEVVSPEPKEVPEEASVEVTVKATEVSVKEETKDIDPKRDADDDESFQDTVRTPAEAVKTTTVEVHQDRTERMSDEKEGESKVSLDINVNGRDNTAQNNMSQGSDTTQDDLFRSEGRTRTTGNAESHTNHNNNIFIQNLTNAVENTLEAVAETSTLAPHSTMVDAMDLIEQINSQIRAVIDNETQSLAMQLHPESLGRMNVELVSKGGQITAQFEAENASVRAALESHIAELKQTLEQRGLRVENVEVTVATHEFEQNLMGGEQSGEASQGSGKGRRARNINLNDLNLEDIPEEEMEEEERIAREMMAANGNSVDFTA
jgi:flagellar hook-length control protein FliK